MQKSVSSAPADSVSEFQRKRYHAQIFGMAGMAPEAAEILEALLQPPSNVSVYRIDLDPAFDEIRDDPAFVAMMERNR